MKTYIPNRLFIFVISIISVIAIYMIYQTVVFDRIQYENFDPNPYSNTYFPPEDRLLSPTEVYDTIDPNLNTAVIKELRDVPEVNMGSSFRNIQFQYKTINVPKMDPKALIVSSNTDLNMPTSVSISFLEPEHGTVRTVRSIQVPDLNRAYYLYVPVRWDYLVNNINDLTNKVLIIPDTNFASQATREAEWKTNNNFVEGDFYIFATQGEGTTRMKIQIFKKTNATEWTEVFGEEKRNRISDLRKEYVFEFASDTEHVRYEPASENQYTNFSNAITNFKNTRNIFQIVGQSFMLKCPYSYYQQSNNTPSQGFTLSGFNVDNDGKSTPVRSNMNNTPFNLNTMTIRSNGWRLTQVPEARNLGANAIARMGGFPLTSPRLNLIGQTTMTIPAPILGQPRMKTLKLRVIVVGSFTLALNGVSDKLINIPDGGTGEISLDIEEPTKGKSWDFIFTWNEPATRRSGQNYSFEVQYRTIDETNQETDYQVVPIQMLSAPQPYYLGFNSTGTQRDSNVFLTKAEATTYRPSVGETRATGVIEYLPKIEWEVESLTAPLDGVWSLNGEQETANLSGFVRIRSKPMEDNDAIYYLSVNPATNEVGVSLDGGGFQSAWSMETVQNLPNTYFIRSGYEELAKTYLSYQYIKRTGDNQASYLLRSNVTLSKEPCPWNIVYTAAAASS